MYTTGWKQSNLNLNISYLGDAEQGGISIMMTRKIKSFPCIKVLSFDAAETTFPIAALKCSLCAFRDSTAVMSASGSC